MRALLLSFILLLAGVLSGCTSDRPGPTTSQSATSTPTPSPGLGPSDFPLALNITGDLGLRIATAGPDKCKVHVAASFNPDGTAPWMAVVEEETGALFLYAHTGPSVHAGVVDTFQESDGQLQAWNVSVGTAAQDFVTVALKNLAWWPNEFTREATFRVWTDCRVEDVQRFSFVQLADDYSFRGGAGTTSTAARTNVDDRWSVTVPGNATLVGRHDHRVFRMDWATPSGALLWENRSFLANGPPGQYDATVTSSNAAGAPFVLVVLAP